MDDFDQVIERRGTHALEVGQLMAKPGPASTRPTMRSRCGSRTWIFAAPPGVTAALREEVERATHGYYANTGSWAEVAARAWMSRSATTSRSSRTG